MGTCERPEFEPLFPMHAAGGPHEETTTELAVAVEKLARSINLLAVSLSLGDRSRAQGSMTADHLSSFLGN
jgi:hypothetical protein